MSSLKGKRVLIVEDEFVLAEELDMAVEAAGGFVLGPFASVSEAVKALDAQVDLAILNVRVRDGLTYPLAVLLRSRKIPFLFASGQDSDNEPPEWRSAPWISKPYVTADVIGCLETISSTETPPTKAFA